MRKLISRIIKRVSSVMMADTNSRIDRINEKVDVIAGRSRALEQAIEIRSAGAGKVERLEGAVKGIDATQPLYGIEGLNVGGRDVPPEAVRRRAQHIQKALGGDVHGMRMVDVGSSLGYLSFFMADRGARVEGWDFRAGNTEISQQVKDINNIANVSFKTRELTLDIVESIQPGRYDAAMIMSVLHQTIMHNSYEYVQNLMYELLERVPIVIVELAQKGEDKNLKWDKTLPKKDTDIFEKAQKLGITIEKIGEFETFPSGAVRPMYKVYRDHLKIDNKIWQIDRSKVKAYNDSTIPFSRTFYTGEDVFVKEYALMRTNDDLNKQQIINEVNFYLRNKNFNTPNIPRMIAYEIGNTSAHMVLNKVEGVLLDEVNETDRKIDIPKMSKALVETLAFMESKNQFHNDLRSWNVMIGPKEELTLIDFGFVDSVERENNRIALIWAIHSALTKQREPDDRGKTTLPDEEPFTEDPYLHKLYQAVNNDSDVQFSDLEKIS